MGLFAPADISKLATNKDVKGLVKALRHEKDAKQRKAAATALGDIADKGSVDGLIAALKDREDIVRWAAARALGKIGDTRAADPLAAALAGPWVPGDNHFAWALGQLGDVRAIGPLIFCIRHEGTSYDAVSALATIGTRAVEPLAGVLHERDQLAQQHAAEALGKIGGPRAVELLVAALDDPEKFVRWGAARALGQIGDPGAVETLIVALKQPEWEVRWAASEALGLIGDPRAVEPLIAALQDRDWHIPEKVIKLAVNPRAMAATALGRIGDPRAGGALSMASQDGDADVRAAAAAALGQPVPGKPGRTGTQALGEGSGGRLGLRRVHDLRQRRGPQGLRDQDPSVEMAGQSSWIPRRRSRRRWASLAVMRRPQPSYGTC